MSASKRTELAQELQLLSIAMEALRDESSVVAHVTEFILMNGAELTMIKHL